jgi:2-amino-4-hydroxy-6-hydroxymethyldihydropteridine diphosphokinase
MSGIFKSLNNLTRPFSPLTGAHVLNSNDYITLNGLKIKCIIGIFEWERRRKQDVVIDLKFPCDIQQASKHDRIQNTTDYKKIAKTVISFVEKSRFFLLETLAEKIADLLLDQFRLSEVFLSVSKPGAIRGSKSVGVNIQRRLPVSEGTLVILSLGSNIYPSRHLNLALNALNEKYELVKVSRVYETSPVKLKKQPPFWNMVVAIQTNDNPLEIREWLKALERKAGRIPQKNPYGPRTLDVDLILWKNQIKKTSKFTIPHSDIATKAFVLFPLVEILPNLRHPKLKKTMIEIASRFNNIHQKIKQLPKDSLLNSI